MVPPMRPASRVTTAWRAAALSYGCPTWMRISLSLAMTDSPPCRPADSMKPAAARRTSADVRGCPEVLSEFSGARVPGWLLGVVMIRPAFFYGPAGSVAGGQGYSWLLSGRAVVRRVRGPGVCPGGRGCGQRQGLDVAGVVIRDAGVVPPARGRLIGYGDAGVDVLVLAALGKRPAPAEQDGE